MVRPSLQLNACFACDATGAIARHPTETQRFASEADLERLRFLRTQHHAILIGGNTFRAWPHVHRHPSPLHPTPIHILITRDWQSLLNSPLWRAWQGSPFPLWILSSVSPPQEVKLKPPCFWIPLPKPEDPMAHVAPNALLTALHSVASYPHHKVSSGVLKVMVCGGASLYRQLQATGLIETLYLTRCPITLSRSQETPLKEAPPLVQLFSHEAFNAWFEAHTQGTTCQLSHEGVTMVQVHDEYFITCHGTKALPPL
ncbi:MAG: dihydrofolate reductase family protein [Vampirovibrionales bacterium]